MSVMTLRRSAAAAVAVVVAALGGVQRTLAQSVGTAFTFQGELRSAGAPVAVASDLQFKLFDALTGGAQVGSTLTASAVTPVAGRFTVDLDFGPAFAGNARFLEIAVRSPAGSGGFTTLTPRQPVNPTPYAMFAPSSANAGQLNGQSGSFYSNAANLTGTLADARLSTNIPRLNAAQTFSGASVFSNASNSFAGDGAGLLSLNASNISTGTVPDARLSPNVPLLNASNTFAGAINSFTGLVGVGVANPQATLDISGSGVGVFPDVVRAVGQHGASVRLIAGTSDPGNNPGFASMTGGGGFSSTSGTGGFGGYAALVGGHGGDGSGAGNTSGRGGDVFISPGASGSPSGGATKDHSGSVFIRWFGIPPTGSKGGVRIEETNTIIGGDNARAMLEIKGGDATFPVLAATGTSGAPISLIAGPGTAAMPSGPVTIMAGSGPLLTPSVSGANVLIQAGRGSSQSSGLDSGNGGDIVLRAGAAGSSTSGVSGSVLLPNPGDPNARLDLGWTANVAHIEVGGTGAGSIGGLDVQGSTQASLLRVLDSGAIGMGTAAPATKLHVVDSTNLVARFQGGQNLNSELQLTENLASLNGAALRYDGVANTIQLGSYNVDTYTAALRYSRGSANLSALGDLAVTGTLSKGGGSFKIDHPLDPENKYLYHSFVESPDMKNIYDGVATLDPAGRATVELPEWFGALNRDFRYQLTCIGGFAPVYIASRIDHNRFVIAGGTPGLDVSWQVTGIRKDAFANARRIPVEEDKPARLRGTYLHPDAWGKPAAAGESFVNRPAAESPRESAADQ